MNLLRPLQVANDSVAAKVGLHAGDIVVRLAGSSADGMTYKDALTAIRAIGDTLVIIVERCVLVCVRVCVRVYVHVLLRRPKIKTLIGTGLYATLIRLFKSTFSEVSIIDKSDDRYPAIFRKNCSVDSLSLSCHTKPKIINTNMLI